MQGHGFGEIVHLVLRGSLPDAATARIIEAILISAVDHGPDAPSIHVTRSVASCGVPLPTAVAAGISSIGQHHGGAGEECARLLQEALKVGTGSMDCKDDALSLPDLKLLARSLVESAQNRGERLPGFGHRKYKDSDPRATLLLEMTREAGKNGKHIGLALSIERELALRTGHALPLNIDGAHAAILSDLGYPPIQMRALFIIGRSVGLCAHAAEELDSGKPLGYLGAARLDFRYTGPADTPETTGLQAAADAATAAPATAAPAAAAVAAAAAIPATMAKGRLP